MVSLLLFSSSTQATQSKAYSLHMSQLKLSTKRRKNTKKNAGQNGMQWTFQWKRAEIFHMFSPLFVGLISPLIPSLSHIQRLQIPLSPWRSMTFHRLFWDMQMLHGAGISAYIWAIFGVKFLGFNLSIIIGTIVSDLWSSQHQCICI